MFPHDANFFMDAPSIEELEDFTMGLFNDDKWRWNLDLLDELFTPYDIIHICRIPLKFSKRVDSHI